MQPIAKTIAQEMADGYKVTIANRHKPVSRAVLHTPQEIRKLVGDKLSVRINFVPQMLTALALEMATEFINHCRDHRVEAAKKPNRLMKRTIEAYSESLFNYYGKTSTAAYLCYVRRFMDVISTDLFLLRLKLSELVANQMPQVKDREVPVLCCAICGVISYTEWYDRQMDRLLEEKLDQPVECKSNKYLEIVKALCAQVATDMDCRIDVDKDNDVADWLNILGNRARALAEQIFDEEFAKSEGKS